MTENITIPTRTVDDILEALFPCCTDPLEGFKFLAPISCDCEWHETRGDAVNPAGAGLSSMYLFRLQKNVYVASASTGR